MSTRTALLRAGVRHLVRSRMQTALLVLGIALGVAVVSAIDLATAGAASAFRESAVRLTGRATHQLTSASGHIPDSVFTLVRTVAGIRFSAPVIEGLVDVAEGTRPVLVLGVDPFAEAPFRSFLSEEGDGLSLGDLRALLTIPGAAAVSEGMMRELGLGAGDTLHARDGARAVAFIVTTILAPADEGARRGLDNLLITDIASAQETLGMEGRLSRVDLRVDTSSVNGRAELARIRGMLPPGVRLEPAGGRASVIASMTEAFELNLFALSLLALLVGMFLIYDSVTVSVLRRRPMLATLRALGATRGDLLSLILTEAAMIGVAGAGLGVLVGVVLGDAALALVSRTVSDLYFTTAVSDPPLDPMSLVKAAMLGIVASMLAAIPPAREAARTSPVLAFRRSDIERRLGTRIRRLSISGIVLLVAGGMLPLVDERGIATGFAAIFVMLTGAALLTPLAVRIVMRIVQPLTARLFGVPGRLAPRAVDRALSRTAVAIASLMIAVSVIVGVNTMVGSFRSTVERWLHETLSADLFITIPFTGAGRASGVDRSISSAVAEVPGVASVETARSVRLVSERYGPVTLIAVTRDVAERRRYLRVIGDRGTVPDRVRAGEVMISEPFARAHGLLDASAPFVVLDGDAGPVRFRVAAVYSDFTADGGAVLLHDGVYRRHWRDTLISSVAAFVSPGTNADSVAADVRQALAARVSMIVQTNRGLRESALVVFDRTFTITGALQLLAAVVAFIGVLGALAALQIERGRELGTLRALGMTSRSLRAMVTLETGLMGLCAGLLALPVGLLMSIVLISIINLRSFGWTLDFVPDPMHGVQAMLVAVVAAILAGLLPSRRFARLRPADVLRSE